MHLTEYMQQVRKPAPKLMGDYRDRCSWCFGMTASTDDGLCVCVDPCGQGVCAADMDSYTPPPVPRFIA